jgi:hypothetical protein
MAIFNWGKKQAEIESAEVSRVKIVRPLVRDWTEDMVSNSSMLSALYHNDYPGLKLAGSLAFPAIAVPVYFMGLPIPTANGSTQKELDDIQQRFITDEQQVHIHCHREGTIWIWPKFDQATGHAIWEFIPDDAVCDPIKDLYTGTVKKLYTDEQITIATGYNERQIVRRIREYTDRYVNIRYEPNLPGLENRQYRNNLGIMPIPFANNADGGMLRGHSDLGRILSDLKVYHDTELAQHEVIAKFRTKLVQSCENVDDWIAQNGLLSDLSDLNVSTIDVIFNLTDKEKTELLSMQSLATPYIDVKKQLFHKIVQGTSVPEICWGLKTEGNHASVEEQMTILAHYVDDKKRQKQESYDKLWTATLMLERRGATMKPGNETVHVEWDQMETVSAETKAQIFKGFAEGLDKIANSATGTKEQLWKLWRKNYPGITDEDEQKYITGIRDMAEHKQFTTASWADIQLGMGADENIDNGDNV